MKRLHTYSQNFLRSPAFAEELIGRSSLSRHDTVYDIGAGSGVITTILAKRCHAVIAIEVEPTAAALLRKNLQSFSNVEIQEVDFLSISLPDSPYKIFANIPFHLSSAIVQKVTQANTPPIASYLIVQKQFANKLLPNHPGFSSQLGMLIGPQFSVAIRRHLRRTDFTPPPNVDTVLLEITHRSEPLIKRSELPSYRQFVMTNFTKPAAFSQLPLDLVSASPAIKPSSLTLSQWLILFAASRRKNHS